MHESAYQLCVFSAASERCCLGAVVREALVFAALGSQRLETLAAKWVQLLAFQHVGKSAQKLIFRMLL
jgi:hypothetical protein